MSIFDERLRRLKHASQMAVTQRDHPRSDAALAAIPTPPTPLSPWSPALPSRPGGAQFGRAVATRSGPRRVTARLLSAPSGPTGPDDLTDWPPAAQPGWNDQPTLDAPRSPNAQSDLNAQPRLNAQPSPAPRLPASPPAPLMNDPYGDVEEALAAGLSAHPPLGLLPPEPLPARAAPREEEANRPSPLRPASFMETMALNTPPTEAPGNREDGPAPVREPRADTRPQEATPAEHPARAVSAVPSEPAAPAGEPSRAPGHGREPTQTAPAPAEVTARTPDVPVSPAEQDLAGSATPAPASAERPLESAPVTVAPPAVTPPPGQTAGTAPDTAEAAPDGEEPALVFPEVLPPDVRERQEQERRELEQLLRSGNNDIPVRLPRRPRPQVAPIAAPVVEEEVKPADPIPQEVSQNILARLNRFAELEERGEVEASALGVGQLHTWQDHHPERNVSLPPAGLDADSAVDRAAPSRADQPRPDQPGARGAVTPRLRARASRSGRSADRRTPDGGPPDPDEEPDTAGRARPSDTPTGAAPSPAPPTPDRPPVPEASAPSAAPPAARQAHPAQPPTGATPERAAPDRPQPVARQTDPGGIAAPPVTPAPVLERPDDALSPGPDPAAGSVQRRAADVPFPDGPAVEATSQPGPAPAPVRPDVFMEASGEPDAPSVTRPGTNGAPADAPADTSAADTDAAGTAAGTRESGVAPSVPVILPRPVAPLASDHTEQPPTPVVLPALTESASRSAAPTDGPARVPPLTAPSVGLEPLPGSAAPPPLERRIPRPETPPTPVPVQVPVQVQVPVRPVEPRPTPVIPTAETLHVPGLSVPRGAERPAGSVVAGQPDGRVEDHADDRAAASAASSAAPSAAAPPVDTLPLTAQPYTTRPSPVLPSPALPSLARPSPLPVSSAPGAILPGEAVPADLGRQATATAESATGSRIPAEDRPVNAGLPVTDAPPIPRGEATRNDARASEPRPQTPAVPTGIPAPVETPAPVNPAAPPVPASAPVPEATSPDHSPDQPRLPAPAVLPAQAPEAAELPAGQPAAVMPAAVRPPSDPLPVLQPVPVGPVTSPAAPARAAMEFPFLPALGPVRTGEASSRTAAFPVNPTPSPLEVTREGPRNLPRTAPPVQGAPGLPPAGWPVQTPAEETAELAALPGTGQQASPPAQTPAGPTAGPEAAPLPSPDQPEARPTAGAPLNVMPAETAVAAPVPQADQDWLTAVPAGAQPVLPVAAFPRLAAEASVTGPAGVQPAPPALSPFTPPPVTPLAGPLRPVAPVEVPAGSSPVRPVRPGVTLPARPVPAAPRSSAPVQRLSQAPTPVTGQPDASAVGQARAPQAREASTPADLRPPLPAPPVPVMPLPVTPAPPTPSAGQIPVAERPGWPSPARPVELPLVEAPSLPVQTLPTPPQPVLPGPPVVTPVQANGPLRPETWPVAAAPVPGQPFALAAAPDRVRTVAVPPDAFAADRPAADRPGTPVPARAASGPGELTLPAPVVPTWFPTGPAPVRPAPDEAFVPGEPSLERVLDVPVGAGFHSDRAAPPVEFPVPVTVPLTVPVTAPVAVAVPAAVAAPLPFPAPLPESVPVLPGVEWPPVGGSPTPWDDAVRAALPSLFAGAPQIRAVLPGGQTSPLTPLRAGAEIPVVPGVQAVTPLGVPPAGAPQGPGLNGPQSQLLRALQAAVRQDGHGQPLAPGAQASLARLMGTSVADVRVIRNAGVPAALQAARADALTVGRTVFLSPDTPLDSGAGQALAAHEFTHALRQRSAGFVPDVLRRAPVRPDSSAEEAVALATEHASVHGPDGADQPTPMRRLPGLPAPWEPLPWETGSFGTGGEDRPDSSPWPEARPAREVQSPLPVMDRPVLPPVPGQGAGFPGGLGNVVNAAATDRAKPQEARDTQAGAPPVGRRAQGAPSVDLDQVAREVYARLRERLSSELRRH